MKKLVRIGLALLTVCLLALTLTAVYAPESFRRDLVMRFSLEEREPGIWCRPGLADADFNRWKALLEQGQAQAAPYCPQGIVPTVDIILADNGELKEQLAVGNPFAKSLFHRDEVLAMISPRGNNPDVIAHLLVHVAIKQELGEARFAELPIWFDEGVAAQADSRPFLSPAALAALPGLVQSFAPDSRPELERFLGKEGEEQLALAKRQLSQWQQSRIPGAEWALVRAFAAGGEFSKLYSDIGLATTD